MAFKKDNSDSIHIGGVPIKFPCKPYGSQLSMMAKIVRGIDRRQNCLLESPTGSGKSLALLCSSLGWQKHEYEKQLIAQHDVSTGGDTESPTALSHCTLCHCHSKQEGEQDTLSKDLPQDGLASTSDKPTVDNVTTTKNDDDDSDIFQTDQIKFRTPGSKARAKQCTDEDEEPSKSRCVATDRKTTSGEKLLGVSCSCACHSLDKPCMGATDEAEPIRLPKIYFGTRTHKQIAQIIRELKRTAYSEVKMAILGSREHLCVHPEVSRSKNKNDGCRELLDTKTGISCRYYANVQKIKHHWQLEGHGLTSAWDVEDLVKLGKKIKSCPYFATRSLANDADVIFCPYNYLIDPLIRSSMDITLKDQIIILDEAHNIEDSAREAASATIRADELQDVMDELDKLIQYKWREEHCRAMHVVAANLQRWISSQSGSLSQNDFNKASKVWSGVEMVAQFNNMGVSPGTYDVLKHHLAALFEEPNPQIPVEEMMSLTSASGMLLRGLFIIVDYFFRENMVYMKDYKVVMIKEFSQRKGRDNTDNRWLNPRRGSSERLTYSLNFWCMNPAVAFSDVGGEARTIILTSGTLSPMGSFASELGVEFSISLEANHVIKDSQVWVGSIATGPTGKTLNASYRNTETFNFQDDLGRLVLDVCKTIPFGVLCFFSSYSLMLKLSERWKNTRLWSEISEKKIIMTEARGGMKKEFDEQLKEFYSTIEDFESSGIEDRTMTGVLFLAVCRGKVSEGMDFADNNARAVITVGIPFPSFKDPQVELKRAYNDQNRDRGLLSGSEWYEIQAYRALNQALGRCLRHRNDWGALILVDERFRRNPQKYISGLSKWVRHKVNHFLHSRDGVDSLKNFVTRQQKISEHSDSQTSPAGSQTFHDPSSTPLPSSSEGTSCSSHPATPTTPRHLVSTPLQFNKFAKPTAVMHGFHAISLKESRFDKSSPQSTNRFQTPTGKKPNSYTSHCVSEEKLPATTSQTLAHTPSRSVNSVSPTMCLDSEITPLKNGPYYHCADTSGKDKVNTNCLPNSGGLCLTPEVTKTNMKSEPTIIPSSASETNIKSSETPKPLIQQSLSSFMHSPNSGKGLLKKLTFSDKTHQSNTECETTTSNVAGRISPDEGEEEVIKEKEKESLTENTALQTVKAEEVHVEEPAGTPPSLFPEDSAEVDDTTTVNYLSVKEVEIELLDQETQIVVENEEDTSLLQEEESSQETLKLNEEVTVDKNDNSIHDTPSSVTKKQNSKLNNSSVRRSTRSKLRRRSTSSKKEQTPLRKRTCCHDDEETEEQEDTLLRKSKRSKKDSSLTVKERMDLNPDVLDVSCPSCGNIICKSGITEVPANVITSTYLLEQLALKAEPGRRTSPRKRTVSNVRNDTALRVCPDSPVNVVVPYVKKKGPDVYKLNAHWSEEDDCCFQPVFCPDCADTKNGSSSAIGHKVVCVGQTKQIFNLGEVSFVKQK
ncbi:Fanconi anemia group J protein homolog isoform X3 [Apostichopus japonicus]|uniref:Fanconi anemia group J protein homolog isoform X3 n=1 Tax=Stichopus japonicus TaxID=307972 RepID=UPI003AB70DA2